jgi:hypothetical protein
MRRFWLFGCDYTRGAPDLLTSSRRPGSPQAWKGGAVEAMLGPSGLLQHAMLLAPFLGTHDLLKLSESATWLVPFRLQLSSVQIVKPEERARKRGLFTVISGQRRLQGIFLQFANEVRCVRWPGHVIH